MDHVSPDLVEQTQAEMKRERRRDRFRWFLIVSLGLHAGISLLTFVPSERPRVQVTKSESVTKFYPAEFFLRGGVRAPDTHKPIGRRKHAAAPKKTTADLAQAATPAPPAGAPVATHHDPVPGTGADAQNAQPAFPVFSPRPAVSDRALLPTSDQQIIVDVKVSALGEVLDASLVKGLGNRLDSIVLETVKTWKFHPATVDGTPVATESELIFPFNQSYPTNPA